MTKSRSEFEKSFPKEYIEAADAEGLSDVLDNSPIWFIEHLRKLDEEIGVGLNDFLSSLQRQKTPIPDPEEEDDEIEIEEFDDDNLNAIFEGVKELDRQWEAEKVHSIKV